MKVSAFLIIGREVRHGRVRRVWIRDVRQNRPALADNEAMLRLVLDLPDDAFDAPIVTVPVEKKQLTVAVELEEVSDDAAEAP